jgi:hypothetical protein
VGAFLAYASVRGHALIDRELYLPESWISDRDRCRAAGVPGEVEFATKPRQEYWNGPLWWYRTSPRSPFATAPISIARTERGRKTLRGNVLITESAGQRVPQRFDSDEAC